MNLLLRYKLLFILPFLIAACKTDKQLVDTTYFGGKIVNPKASHVLFYKGQKLLDSVSISNKNKFMFKFNELEEGLYSFFHGDEFQFIFLQPNDSLLLRLNTWDFDESLVFSGKGSERNNLLINLFLVNEKEDKLFYNYYKLEEEKFEHVIDSLINIKQLLYTNLEKDLSEGEITPMYEKYAEALITLPLYRKKEAYPHWHKKTKGLAASPEIDPTFYNYRKKINFNDENLANFYVYQDYIRTYLNHLSYEKYLTSDKEKPMALFFLNEIAQNVQNDKLRNHLLDEAMWNLCLVNELSSENLEEAKTLFYKKCNDKKLLEGIETLLQAKEGLPKASKLPEVIMYNNAFNKIRLNDVVKGQPTVVYFWPKKAKQVENLSKRVSYLEKQYPDILFVGINSKFPTKNWNASLKKLKFNAKNQFLLDKEVSNDWLHLDFSRAIIVDKNGFVHNGFTHLNTRSFEDQLKNID